MRGIPPPNRSALHFSNVVEKSSVSVKPNSSGVSELARQLMTKTPPALFTDAMHPVIAQPEICAKMEVSRAKRAPQSWAVHALKVDAVTKRVPTFRT
jgi:hypothetical protein